MAFALKSAEPAALDLNPEQLGRLEAMISAHIRAGRYPGAQIAVALLNAAAMVPN